MNREAFSCAKAIENARTRRMSAAVSGEALLFKGDDFAHTDVAQIRLE